MTQAIKRAHELFRKRFEQPRPVQAAADRLQPDFRGDGIAKAELVIEAIFEDIPAKQALFQADRPGGTGFWYADGSDRTGEQRRPRYLPVGREKLADFLHTPVPEIQRTTVAEGNLGRKSGRGFYVYEEKGPVKARWERPSKGSEAIAERMILRLLNESIACPREGVVEDADLLDAGVVFGTGFAPFRGGPIHYIRESGWDRIRDRLLQME